METCARAAVEAGDEGTRSDSASGSQEDYLGLCERHRHSNLPEGPNAGLFDQRVSEVVRPNLGRNEPGQSAREARMKSRNTVTLGP